MSSSDLFVEGYPHGTPQGYDNGCRGGACPTGVEYGLSCKIAHQKASGDYQYQRLVKTGATIPDIADALGLVGTAPAPAKTRPTPATAKGGRSLADKPNANAQPATEPSSSAADVTDTRPADEATVGTETIAPAAPKPGEIRAWAREKGYTVGAKGKIPQHIVDHYWDATGRLAIAPTWDARTPPTVAEDTKPPELDTDRNAPDSTSPLPSHPNPVADNSGVEQARALAVRLEQELAQLQEQYDEMNHQYVRLTQDFLERGAEILHLQEQLEVAAQAALAGETATRVALQKWGEERAANDTAYALILEQAGQLNKLNALPLAPTTTRPRRSFWRNR